MQRIAVLHNVEFHRLGNRDKPQRCIFVKKELNAVVGTVGTISRAKKIAIKGAIIIIRFFVVQVVPTPQRSRSSPQEPRTRMKPSLTVRIVRILGSRMFVAPPLTSSCLNIEIDLNKKNTCKCRSKGLL